MLDLVCITGAIGYVAISLLLTCNSDEGTNTIQTDEITVIVSGH